MTNETQSSQNDEQHTDIEQPVTSGHVERTILNQMVDEDGRYRPTAVSDVLEAVAAVIARGDYGNLGPRSPTSVVQKSTVRRAFSQLGEKGLIQRVEDLSESDLTDQRYALGECTGGDPSDPASYSNTADDARVTDWILTDEGTTELDRLDARYAAELDDLAARFGRPRGETTRRIDA